MQKSELAKRFSLWLTNVGVCDFLVVLLKKVTSYFKVCLRWHFMSKLEPISSEDRKLSPDACASKAGTRPARKSAP